MNKKRVILAVLFALLLFAGVTVWRHRPVSSAMRLDLTGTPGLKVAGTIVVNGVSQEFSGVLPAKISVVARTFDYTILMQEPSGQLHGELTVDNGVYGSSSTSNDYSGVKGTYQHTWDGKGGGFTTARKGEK